MLLAAKAPSTSNETYNSSPNETGNATGSLVMRARGAAVGPGEPLNVRATGAAASAPCVPASATVAEWRVSEPSPARKLTRMRPPPRPTGTFIL